MLTQIKITLFNFHNLLNKQKGYPIFTINEENLYLKKGFNLLPQPSECDLFFDIESVQDHVFSGKLEYLFGVFYEENGKKIFKIFLMD